MNPEGDDGDHPTTTFTVTANYLSDGGPSGNDFGEITVTATRLGYSSPLVPNYLRAGSSTNCPKPNAADFSRDLFLNKQYGPASSVGAQWGVDPTLMLGASALETFWGSSSMYLNQNNPFGATPNGVTGVSYPSYFAAWNAWGNQWGPRIQGVGSNVGAFTTALLTDNRGNPNAVDQRGKYNSVNPTYANTLSAVINSVRSRLPAALAAFSPGCQ